MTQQYTVFATDEASLAALLAAVGVLIHGGQALHPGMGYEYKGLWSVGGATAASVCGLIWWTGAAQDAQQQAERDVLLDALRTERALYEGIEQPIYLTGSSGYVQPTGWEWIKRERDARRQRCGVLASGKWFHSDSASRDLYTQAAALVALGAAPAPVPWKTMDGSFVSMTQALLVQVMGAMAISDSSHHVVAEQAKAALAAGTLTDLTAIQWPTGFPGA